MQDLSSMERKKNEEEKEGKKKRRKEKENLSLNYKGLFLDSHFVSLMSIVLIDKNNALIIETFSRVGKCESSYFILL